MHTLLVIGGGTMLLFACLLLGHAWGAGMAGVVAGAKAFIALWLAASAVNAWVGTTHGYSWAEEAPISVAIFALPAAIAGLLWWRLS